MAHEDEFGIVGMTLANAFHVERAVAHGGFASVYRGIHGGFRAPIALKCLRIPDGMTEDQRNTFLERFREEGELLFRLSAAIPEVVRPLHIDAVVLPSGSLMPFLALEWLEGEGFDQVLIRNRRERRPGLDLHNLIDMLRPIAQALSRAHNFPAERGSVCVVHRDLKPENLFICNVAGASSIKILDYGIAEVVSVVQKVSGARSWRGMNPFTPGYGAPEQWAPDRFGACGAWTDVWGLALMLTEALAGKPAIDGDVESMRRAALDPRRRPTPRSLGNIVSNDVERVFGRALALDPRDRTRDVATFWNELESAAGLTPSIVARPGAPPPRASQRRAQVVELEDAPQHAAIDLDLAVAPESLRTGRASVPSIPPPPPAPAIDAAEEDLPTYDDAPSSARPPISTRPPLSSRPPSSTRPPISTRPTSGGSRAAVPGARTSSPRLAALAAQIADAPPDAAPTSARAKMPSLHPPASGGTPAAAPSHSGALPPPASPRPAVKEPETPVEKVIAAVKGRFKVATILLAAAVGITLLDLVAVRAVGSPMSLGPIRSFWLAGPLALAGAILLIWKFVAEEDDG